MLGPRDPSFSGEIGVARRDITPPSGIHARNWGPAGWAIPIGVHRPLALTALVIVDPSPFVLISADLGWFEDGTDAARVIDPLIERLGVDRARVMFHLSHTHSGPSLSTSRSDQPGGELIGPYLDSVARAAVSATEEALRLASPAVLTWRTGRCGLASNRDVSLAGRTYVGFNPEADADDTLLVGRVADPVEGRIVATLVNYACHPTTLAWENMLLSPDYVGAARELIESATGGAPCVFLQGASGDLAPREQYVGDTAIADRHGRELGYSALACLTAMLEPGRSLKLVRTVESGAPLAMWRPEREPVSTDRMAVLTTVDLPLKHMSLPDGLAPLGPDADAKAVAGWLETAGMQPRFGDVSEHVRAERLRRAVLQLAQFSDGPSWSSYPLWVWKLGDAIVVAHRGEAYSDLQTQLRLRHADAAVAVLNCTNGLGPSYLPRSQAYEGDAYPVWQTVFGCGCLERLIAEADSSIRRLRSTTAEDQKDDREPIPADAR